MLSERMNSTRNLMFVVLVATQGIIGDGTTIDPIEKQTNDVLELTSLTNRKGDEEVRTGFPKDTTNTTEEQTTTTGEINSSVSFVYVAPTENVLETTDKVNKTLNSKEDNMEDLETSDDITRSDSSRRSTSSHTVEHSIRKDISNNNEIHVSEKSATDKKSGNKSTDNPVTDDINFELETITEQYSDEPEETTVNNYDVSDIEDYVEKTETTDFLKAESDDMDSTKFYRRMLKFSHSFEDRDNNPETVTVAKTSTTKTTPQDDSPLSHIDNSHNSNVGPTNTVKYEENHQSAELSQKHPVPETPPPLLTVNTPHLNSRSAQSFISLPVQTGSFESQHSFTQSRQFDNNHFIPPQLPTQFLHELPMEQLQLPPQMHQSMHPYHPQAHYPMQLQYPWPTVQPVPNNMDNILASLQQASLHPVMSAKQYKDFYEKQYVYPSNLF